MMRVVLVFISILFFTFKWTVGVEEKLFCFTKSYNSSKEFEYQLDNGETFSGKTTFLFERYESSIQSNLFFNLLLDGNGLIYWVAFTEKELNSSDLLQKSAQPVDRTDNGIEFQDDFYKYILKIGEEEMDIYPYITEWDFHNICFRKFDDNEHLFQYDIKSLNNNRKYTGITYKDPEDNGNSQRIRLLSQGEYIIRIDFEKEEFDSDKTFCRGISEIISQNLVLGAGTISGIDPNALKSLVG